MDEVNPVLSEKTRLLKSCLAQTFTISDLQSLAGLVEILNRMGYQSTATALERVLQEEATHIQVPLQCQSQSQPNPQPPAQSRAAFVSEKSG